MFVNNYYYYLVGSYRMWQVPTESLGITVFPFISQYIIRMNQHFSHPILGMPRMTHWELPYLDSSHNSLYAWTNVHSPHTWSRMWIIGNYRIHIHLTVHYTDEPTFSHPILDKPQMNHWELLYSSSPHNILYSWTNVLSPLTSSEDSFNKFEKLI